MERESICTQGLMNTRARLLVHIYQRTKSCIRARIHNIYKRLYFIHRKTNSFRAATKHRLCDSLLFWSCYMGASEIDSGCRFKEENTGIQDQVLEETGLNLKPGAQRQWLCTEHDRHLRKTPVASSRSCEAVQACLCEPEGHSQTVLHGTLEEERTDS